MSNGCFTLSAQRVGQQGQRSHRFRVAAGPIQPIGQGSHYSGGSRLAQCRQPGLRSRQIAGQVIRHDNEDEVILSQVSTQIGGVGIVILNRINEPRIGEAQRQAHHRRQRDPGKPSAKHGDRGLPSRRGGSRHQIGGQHWSGGPQRRRQPGQTTHFCLRSANGESRFGMG